MHSLFIHTVAGLGVEETQWFRVRSLKLCQPSVGTAREPDLDRAGLSALDEVDERAKCRSHRAAAFNFSHDATSTFPPVAFSMATAMGIPGR